MTNPLKWTTAIRTDGTHLRAMLPTREAFALTIAKLITLSGQDPTEQTDEYKVSVEFIGTFRGEPFTLYDYKEDDEIHIGGSNRLDVDALIPVLMDALSTAEPTPFTARKHYDRGGNYGWPNRKGLVAVTR